VSAFCKNKSVIARYISALAGGTLFLAAVAIEPLPVLAQVATAANAALDPEVAAMKDLAEFVSKDAKKSHLENLLIMDFQGPNHDYSLLGRKLADDLHAALADDPVIKLADRSKYIEFVSREALLIPEANQPDAANWVASQLSAKSFVTGEYDESGSDLILHIKIYDCPKPRDIQNLKATFSNTPEMSALHRRLLAATGDDALSADQKVALSLSSARGYTPPGCVHCPQPPFSPLAADLSVTCTIKLIAEVNETGQITKLFLTRGFFYGLNDKVVDGVKQWRMKPATGPDGRPATVQQAIEVTFRMYQK
jgi:hypothetical protein